MDNNSRTNQTHTRWVYKPCQIDRSVPHMQVAMAGDIPLGRRWKAKVVFTLSGPMGTTIVCPALLPPAHRAQMSNSADKISTNLPLPSSPHCAPRTTVTA